MAFSKGDLAKGGMAFWAMPPSKKYKYRDAPSFFEGAFSILSRFDLQLPETDQHGCHVSRKISETRWLKASLRHDYSS
ncbi:MAG: hypothetical protein PHE47_01660 [Oscillospiraceae bacterium]|nr:hypothetical protein [Oscillospiraceae bacterium]